jgi:phosphoglucosamine mutase
MRQAGFSLTHDTVRNRASAGERPAVLIGKDTRVSGYMMEAALEAGFSAAGVDVSLVGPMPTPAIAYLTRALRLQAGIVISASHNPYYDNGIKFFSAQGNQAAGRTGIGNRSGARRAADLCRLGLLSAVRVESMTRMVATSSSARALSRSNMDLRGLKIVVDCANGAAYHIAPNVFHELGAEVNSIGAEPNGLNINQDVGATAPAALREAVRHAESRPRHRA